MTSPGIPTRLVEEVLELLAEYPDTIFNARLVSANLAIPKNKAMRALIALRQLGYASRERYGWYKCQRIKTP